MLAMALAASMAVWAHAPIAAQAPGVAQASAQTAQATAAASQAPAATLPDRLTDKAFWELTESVSEANGEFQSDNFLSNERGYQVVIPELIATAKSGRVYLGVGPEQNFPYILALKPALAIIFDVRRGNLHEHLLYKALFEMSADRADLVSRLFARKRPPALTRDSTIAEIFDGVTKAEASEALYVENVRAVVNVLTKQHHFVLDAGDLLRLQHDYRAFYLFGPKIQYSSSRNEGGREGEPTYADLMAATDALGELRGYLASDESFRFLKQLESDNMVVPLVGNFAGPRAVRAVGQFLKEQGAFVSVFYVSNVEEYLEQDGALAAFCANVAALPIDETSTFIRSVRGRTPDGLFMLSSVLIPMAPVARTCRTD
jgi:hypothetical protein